MIFQNKSYLIRIVSLSVIIIFSFSGCRESLITTVTPSENSTERDFYTQGNNNRTAAEWEPALGTMIAWPLAIPHKLAIELAKDNHLYTVVKNEAARNEAQTWYNAWNIPSDKVTFIITDQGEWSWWTRDWGPSAVFTIDKQYHISNGKFVYGDPISGIGCNDKLEFEVEIDQKGKLLPTNEEDSAPNAVANQLGYPVLDLPFINTGGNVATDGLQTAFSTCILTNENLFHGVSPANFFQMNESMLGIKKYNIISNFEEYGIQHIDCFMKIINEETILVAQPPSDHEMSIVYENIVTNELSKLKTAYGRPYKILRIKIGRYKNQDLAAYTNSLILNKNIYVPLFNIPQDKEALETWRKAMPGYTVKGFTYAISDEPIVAAQVTEQYGSYGWNYGDALHCRTRAIWDPEMLFITTKSIQPTTSHENQNKVFTTIIDYSKNGIDKDNCKLLWRVKGESNWNEVVLSQVENENHFFAEIPNQESGITIEYHISARSFSGKTETQPRTAPMGNYEFSVQ